MQHIQWKEKQEVSSDFRHVAIVASGLILQKYAMKKIYSSIITFTLRYNSNILICFPQIIPIA